MSLNKGHYELIFSMSIKKLAGETAIYGGSQILTKLINFALVPLYTDVLPTDEFGIQTTVYTLTFLLLVIAGHRIEVAYFRYASDNRANENAIFSTAALSVIVVTVIVAVLLYFSMPALLRFTPYFSLKELFYLALIILCVDAVNAMLNAKLRFDNRPIQFAMAQLGGVVLIVAFNLIFFKLLGYTDLRFIFIANIIGSIATFLILSPQLFKVKLNAFDWILWKQMIRFAAPLIVVGMSFMVNETIDRLLIPLLAPGDTQAIRDGENGIYSAMYKLTMFIALFRQAFQYAGEPFFFQQKNDNNAKFVYADVANFFTIVVATGFLGVMLYLDIIAPIFIQNDEYLVGLHVVPILLMANLLLGIYYNFSVWYKVTDRTIWGAYIALGGAVITVVLNLIFIPKYSYTAAAWVTLITYGTMTIASYFIGQRHYKVPYRIDKMLLYIGLAVAGYWLSEQIRFLFEGMTSPTVALAWRMLVNTFILLFYLSLITATEWKRIERYFGERV